MGNPAFGTRAMFKKCDVSNWDDVLDLFQETHDKFGIIHSVLSNAGINTHEHLLLDEFDAETGKLLPPSLKSIDVNLIGQLYIAWCALYYFRKWPDTPGQLVMTSSAGAFFPAPPIYMYCAAKSGVLGLMRSLQAETGKHKVTVNVVASWLTGKASFMRTKATTLQIWTIAVLIVHPVTPMLLPEWLQKWGDLPKNSATGVARALFLPITQPQINGKSFFVAGDNIFEFKQPLYDTEPVWMGKELCDNVRRGQKILLGKE
jgi:NAD(P)-dependent dehydrogenase (short-subunit alcohol dehydrogenase family)